MKPHRLLYPFGLIYGCITLLRNWCFDLGLLKQRTFPVPVIAVGNLSMGGTGKTPFIEYLIEKYQATHNIAVVSRGYNRKTKGFLLVESGQAAELCGDEPLQIKTSFPDVTVAVDGNRCHAIDTLLAMDPRIDLVLLDDGFQHRYVKPAVNILLTASQRPFWNDLVVPAGYLREYRTGWRRAHAIIVTKCPEGNRIDVPSTIRSKPVFFTSLTYGEPRIVQGTLSKNILLVTGIADPSPMVDFLTGAGYTIREHFRFGDHHNFTESEILSIELKGLSGSGLCIMTTEKDWMRLKTFPLNDRISWAVLPVKTSFIGQDMDWLGLGSTAKG